MFTVLDTRKGSIIVEIIDNSDGEYGEFVPVSNRVLSVECSDYNKPADGPFDIEEFEDRTLHIYCPCAKKDWRFAYAVARRIASKGIAYLPEVNMFVSAGSQIKWGF